MSRTKKLVLCAFLAALGVVILLASGLYPPIMLAVTAMAGLIGAVAVIHCGVWWSLGTYLVTAGLALLVLPEKSSAIWYAAFFGFYPAVKCLLERIPNRVLSFLCRLAVFAASLVLLYFVFRAAFVSALPNQTLWVVFAALFGFFVLYDIAFSAAISYYYKEIAPHVDNTIF